MSKKDSSHLQIRNGHLFCTHCGGRHRIPFPLAVDKFSDLTENFTKLHMDCEKTWNEPEYDESVNWKTRIHIWLNDGEPGISSKTIVQYLTGVPTGLSTVEYDHPHDPDDFSRCYKLLILVPELKPQLERMKKLSNVWESLIDNWDKLTEMYESKSAGMYDFMQQLGC